MSANLRVAHVWRGEVMAERYFYTPENVSVGTQPGSTLTIGDIGLPAKLELLRATQRGWLLTLGQGMSGEVSLGGRQQKVAEVVDGGGALDRSDGAAGAFRAVPVQNGDWGVIHLDGLGEHVIFFRFDSPPPSVVDPRPHWQRWLAMLLEDPIGAALVFSVVVHVLLLFGVWLPPRMPVTFDFKTADALAGIMVTRPPGKPDAPPEKEVPQAGTDDGDEKAPPASAEGEAGKSGGKGEKPRERDMDPGDTAPVDPVRQKARNSGLLVHSGKLARVGSAMESPRLGAALSRLKGPNNGGGAGYGDGEGTGVGKGKGTGTLTRGTGNGVGGGGTAHADVVTGDAIKTGGTRPAKGVPGGSPKETEVKVAMGDPEGSFDGLTREQVMKVVMARRSMFQACFEKELQRLPNLSGNITITWRIDATGTVTMSKLKSSTMGNAAVENCMVRRVKDLKFPASADGAPTTVNFPFGFAPRK